MSHTHQFELAVYQHASGPQPKGARFIAHHVERKRVKIKATGEIVDHFEVMPVRHSGDTEAIVRERAEAFMQQQIQLALDRDANLRAGAEKRKAKRPDAARDARIDDAMMGVG